jgi:subtilisin family serine protease
MALTVLFILTYSPIANSFWDPQRQQEEPQAIKPSTLVVKYKPDIQLHSGYDKDGVVLTNKSELNAINKKYSVKKQERVLHGITAYSDDNPLKDVFLLYPEDKEDIAIMAHEFAGLDCVEYAHPNYPLQLYAAPDDSLFGHQWAIHNTGQGYYHVLRREDDYNDTLVITFGTPDADIDAFETMENPPDNTQTVVIAIIDTGVDRDHPDLSSNIWNNPGEIPDNGIDDDHNGYVDDIYGWNFVTSARAKENNSPLDDHGHGTHCAGIVAAGVNNGFGTAGVTPDARIMAVKIFYDFSVLNACRGIIYAANNGADVINMSWGLCWPVPILEQALDYAHSRGVILVAAAGNHGDDRTAYPSGYSTTIAVTASNSDDHVTDFSTHNDAVNICAPGQSILSLKAANTDMYAKYNEPNVHIIDNNYYLATGTSMASPHVVAVAGYMRAVSPGLSPDVTLQIMESTADDFIDPYGTGASMPGWDKYSGHGRVNLPAALAATPKVRARITTPRMFSVMSGSFGVYGSADGSDFLEYILEYGPGDDPSEWTEIAASSVPVTEALLGTMAGDTLQGPYVIRLRANETNTARTHIYITNYAVAEIQYPADAQSVAGTVGIMGSALCEDFSYSVVEYGFGDNPGSWHEIRVNTVPVYEGELAVWNTIHLATGVYTIRASVYSTTGLEAVDSVTISIESVFTPPDGWLIDVAGTLAPIANYADVNQDGVNEILMGTSLGMKILSTDGTVMTTDIPNFLPDDYRIPPAVGRLDNDYFDDIVAVTGSGILYGFPSQADPFFIVLAEAPDDMDYFIPGDENRLPRVFLKDINGDNIDEIHYFPGPAWSTRSGYHFIFNADGSEWGCGFPPPNTYKRCLPADLDGNGIDEIYCYGTDLAEFDTCGQWVRSVSVEWEGLLIEDYQLEMSAADIDIDGKTELIVHGYFAIPPSIVFNYQVFAYDYGLQLKDGWPHDLSINGRLLAPGHPVFGDLDGDSTLEYIMAHNDLEYGYLYAWHIDGTPVLGDDNSDGLFVISSDLACFSAPLLVDCDSDGYADISVASGAGLAFVTMIERILAYNLNAEFINGYPLVVSTQYEHANMHMPVFGDINRDGFLDVVYPSDHSRVAFAGFPQYEYDPGRSFYPMWRYNRRLNATQYYFVEVLCGDADGDESINMLDVLYLIAYLYKGGPVPGSLDAADVNNDGSVDMLDILYLIAYLYKSGPAPVCL